MILTIRTDSDWAELGLFATVKNQHQLRWEAGRSLAETILVKIDELLDEAGTTYDQLTGIVVFKGPGSFTGLRIGATTGNAVAYAKELPIVGTTGEDWLYDGLALIGIGENHGQVVPEYGAEPNITKPKK